MAIRWPMQPHRLLLSPPPFPLPREGGIILQHNARRPSTLCRSSVTVTATAGAERARARCACVQSTRHPTKMQQPGSPANQPELHTMQMALLCNTPHCRLPSVAKSQSGRKKNRRRNRQVFCELGRELSLHSRAPAASPASPRPLPRRTSHPSTSTQRKTDTDGPGG